MIDTISTLLVTVHPLTVRQTVNDAAHILLLPESKKLLCLPVVGNDGLVLGTVSRQRLQNIFMARFGRELYGRRSVTTIMNEHPLLIDIQLSIEQAAQQVSTNTDVPITEDFVIADATRYIGMGFVLDLLKAMETQVHARNAELAHAYSELKSSQAQLIQSEKMASLGQMVAGVAHEINTPLGYIRGNVELTQCVMAGVGNLLQAVEDLLAQVDAYPANQKQLQHNLLILKQASRDFCNTTPLEDLAQLFVDTLYGIDQISEIVLGLKNFSRLDQAALANVNINKCLESTLVIAKNLLKGKCDVVKQLGALPSIRCSPSQINQVLLNLLTNAAHAMEERYGTVVITTWDTDGYVHISIADNGVGISPANLPKIFDPFFTTKPIGQGTGLGLSIVYNIIKEHNGQIQVESVVGTGTKFIVSLPRSNSDNSAGIERKNEHERQSYFDVCG